MNSEIVGAAKLLGSIGGQKGTGEAKRRSKAHYRRIVDLSLKARKLKRKTNKTTSVLLAAV